MGQASACVGKEIGDESPGIDTAASAGFQHAHGGGVGRRALLGAGAVGDPPGNDGVPESALGFVVGGGQIGIGDEGGDGGPVVQHLAGERPNLLVVAVAVAGALQTGESRIEDAGAGALGDLVDQALAQQPRSEVGALRVEATGQGHPLADQGSVVASCTSGTPGSRH